MNYTIAARKTVDIIDEMLTHHLHDKVLVNVNFPNVLKEEEVKGYKHTKQGE